MEARDGGPRASASYAAACADVRRDQRMSYEDLLTEEHLGEMRAAFGVFDRDNSGRLDARELKQALRALGFEPSREEVAHFMADLDKDNSGDVSLDEFTALMCRKVSARSAEKEMRQAFQLIKGEGGALTAKDLRRAANEAGLDDITDEELERAVEHADRNLDGAISEDGFYEAVRKATLFHAQR